MTPGMGSGPHCHTELDKKVDDGNFIATYAIYSHFGTNGEKPSLYTVPNVHLFIFHHTAFEHSVV